MNKSPDAFRTISEVADDLDIPQHVLRFWETRFSSIRPLKRGGGRRYYRPDDVDLLKGIRQLLYGQGYTIKGVQRILKESGPRFVQGIGRGEQVAAPQPVWPEDADEAIETAADDAEAAPAGEPASVARPSPVPTLQGSWPEPARTLAADDVEQLRRVLDELLECQRALEVIRRG